MIDSHAHIDSIYFARDRIKILEKCINEGVTGIVNVGTNYETSSKTVLLAEKHDFLYAAVGIHPINSDELCVKVINDLKKLAQRSKVVAIGEIGLHYNLNENMKKVQRDCFIKQVELAKELDLPIIIHSNNADEEIIEILNNIKIPRKGGVIHCFNGNEDLAKSYINMGLHISIAGNITLNQKQDIFNVIKRISLDKILVETDSPYISPEHFKVKRNYPGNVKYVIETIAQITGKSFEEVSNVTTENARRLFQF
ncbi:TatD family hydrolase [Psychrobacillus sp. L4]|uniref:TatD family hydrolase n=1 Tax=Psychrobacillus sp. L4 TaxID=3236892 RepID=UPI0036F3689E